MGFSRWMMGWTAWALAVAALGCGKSADSIEGAGTPGAPERTFYVSKAGNNADGKSWETAWNELSSIPWGSIQGGDLIVIDGGGEEGMRYESSLVVRASGEKGKPIQIRVSSDEGRSGRVTIFGGRSQPLPSCELTGYSPGEGEFRKAGVDLQGVSWVYIDGEAWGGIRVHGHDGPGVLFSPDSEHLTVRHLEVDDNGWAKWRDEKWFPAGAGAVVSGKHLLLERMLVHDNGGDGIRAQGGIEQLVMRGVWLHNRRGHPAYPGEPFNFCARGDGFHLADGFEQRGFKLEDSMVGPGFAHGLLLGTGRTDEEWALMHDVEVRNTLLVSHHGASAVANVSAMQPPRRTPENWRFERVTSIRDPGAAFANFAIQGAGHVIEDSVLVGGAENVLEAPATARNCQWGGSAGAAIGDEVDPQFVDAEFAGVGKGFSDFDFSSPEGSPCSGRGTSNVSVQALLGQADPADQVSLPGIPAIPKVEPNKAPNVGVILPVDGSEYGQGVPVTIVASASDADGAVARVEFLVAGQMVGTATAEPYSVTWMPQAGGMHQVTVRAVDDKDGVAESLLRVVVRGGGTLGPGTPSTTLEVETGQLTNFMVENGCIKQATSNTGDPNAGGQAMVPFTVAQAGNYVFRGTFTAPSGGENSFFLDVDTQPSLQAIWDLPVTAAAMDGLVTWRGAGSEAAPEFNPRVFNLTAGQHMLVIRGREMNACLDKLQIEPAP